MQDGRSARAQRPRRLMTVQFTRQIARDTSVDSPERDGAEFELCRTPGSGRTGIRESEKTLSTVLTTVTSIYANFSSCFLCGKLYM